MKKIEFSDRNTHHLTYQHLYNEPLGDIVTLCRRCHQSYHRIHSMKKNLAEKYRVDYESQQAEREAMWKAQREEHEREREEQERGRQRLFNDVIARYADKDYSKDGPLNMCDFEVIGRAIEETASSSDYGGVTEIGKTKVRDYFLCRRLEFLKRCIELNIPKDRIINETMLDWKFVNKWDSIEKINKRLEQENFQNNQEDNQS